jgi:hypothetical protein
MVLDFDMVFFALLGHVYLISIQMKDNLPSNKKELKCFRCYKNFDQEKFTEDLMTSFKLGDAPFVKHVGSTTIFVRSNISQTSFKAVHFTFINIS